MQNKSGYVTGIDGLRAYAVVAVILYHFRNSLLPGGFCGVDVFFAISGYVVSRSLHDVAARNFAHFALGFYARRILRIYPALVACLLVTGLLQVLFIPLSWLSTTSYKTGLFAFFGVSNFALIWFNDGYFSPRVEFNAYTHTWSLAVEEQFYLLFPALVFFTWNHPEGRRTSVQRLIELALPLLFAASLICSIFESSLAPDRAYYMLPSRFWELAAGALLFRFHSQGALLPRSSLTRALCFSSGLAFIAIGYLFADATRFPFPWAVPPVLGSLLVMAAAASDRTLAPGVAALFENAPTVYLGKISYSLYLWHWPVAVLLRWTIGLDRPLAIAAGFAVTLAASVASFHLLERPIRQSRYAAANQDSFVVSRGFALIGAAAVISLASFLSQPYISLSVTRDRVDWYHGASSLQVDWAGFLRRLRPAPASIAPAPVTDRRLFVLGDSHAGAYATLEQMLRDRKGMRVEVFMKEACPAAGLLEPTSGACSRYVLDSLASIQAEARPGDLVFLASLRSQRIGDQWRTIDENAVAREQSTPAAALRRQAAWEEADRMLASLEQSGVVTIMDAPLPVFKSPPFRCSDWFNRSNPICTKGMTVDKSFLQDLRAPVMESLARLKARHPSLVVWDPLPVLCPGSSCSAYDGQLPVFFDCDHLSGHGNRLLYPSFESLLTAILAVPPQALHTQAG